jgi:hypothetical protein
MSVLSMQNFQRGCNDQLLTIGFQSGMALQAVAPVPCVTNKMFKSWSLSGSWCRQATRQGDFLNGRINSMPARCARNQSGATAVKQLPCHFLKNGNSIAERVVIAGWLRPTGFTNTVKMLHCGSAHAAGAIGAVGACRAWEPGRACVQGRGSHRMRGSEVDSGFFSAASIKLLSS